jgi:WD40 repeat protein
VLAVCDNDRSQSLHRFGTNGAHDELAGGRRVAVSAAAGRVAVLESTKLSLSSDAGDRREIELGRPATAFAFAGDGGALWIGGPQGIARLPIDEVETSPQPRWRLSPWVGTVRRVSVSPDGARAIAFDDGRHAALWTADGQMIGTLLVGSSLVRWVPQRGAVVVAGAQLDLLLLDARTGAQLGHLGGFTGAITDVAVDEHAEWLVATSRDGGVRAWKLDEASARALPTPGAPCAAASDATTAVCFDSDLQNLVVAPSPVDQRVERRNLELPSSLVPQTLQHLELAIGPRASSAAYVAQGGALVYVQGNRVSVHDVVSHHPVLAFAPSRALLAVGGLAGKRPLLRIMDEGRPRQAFSVPAQPTALAFSPDAKSLLVGMNGGKLLVLDAMSGKQRRAIELARAPLVAVAAADDGQIAAADAHGTVYAAAPEMKRGATVFHADAPVSCLRWSQQSRGLVIGEQSGRVSLLDVETGDSLVLMKIAGAVTSCERSPTEDRLLVTSATGSAWQRVLDLSPLFMARPPVNPLDRQLASVPSWRGLDPEPEP